jgi:hypothetical protein
MQGRCREPKIITDAQPLSTFDLFQVVSSAKPKWSNQSINLESFWFEIFVDESLEQAQHSMCRCVILTSQNGPNLDQCIVLQPVLIWCSVVDSKTTLVLLNYEVFVCLKGWGVRRKKAMLCLFNHFDLPAHYLQLWSKITGEDSATKILNSDPWSFNISTPGQQFMESFN